MIVFSVVNVEVTDVELLVKMHVIRPAVVVDKEHNLVVVLEERGQDSEDSEVLTSKGPSSVSMA